ncbi:transposase [Nitrososphaera sp.]|uniref:transposase n=1 Tax=Nitrososphaera sp. TaxID=1971748 RepID=UPI0017A91B25|nr:transposase [Nitrososphaera sp.]NWG37853.1 transposase [Nitrososphaera sp.]HIK11070.1 transposase [Oscillatoriaceae cyanobacterium M33_DOE_052]
MQIPRDGHSRGVIHSCHGEPSVVNKDRANNKPKPVREDAFPSELVFQKTDLSFVDRIVDPDREKRSGPKGYRPSSIFMALLLMYLQSMDSVLALVRFLNTHPQWLVTLDLRKAVRGNIQYKVPDRTTFYKFAERLGREKMLDIFISMVVQLIQLGIIKGDKVSLDCSIIWAWFKDCKWSNSPRHDKKKCRRNKSRDKDASWTWDSHREKFVYGYKVHIMIDSASGLPVMITVTTAAYGENRTVSWFVRMVLRLGVSVSKFLADAGYDSNETRLKIIRRLKAVPFIPLNTRNASGSTIEEKKARRKELCLKFYVKNLVRNFWVDPDSEEFDREFDARTFSEQGFSVGKGSLNLDSLKHVGIEWATLHSVCICMVMLLVAKTAVEIGRPDLSRCVKCFQG